MTQEQSEQILTVLAYPDDGRDVWALITEDNMIAHGWISPRMELDSNQLRWQKSSSKKAKTAAEPAE